MGSSPLRPVNEIFSFSGEDVGTSVGSYRLLEVVGRGGMGVVYRAQDPSTEQPVAIKMVRMGVGAESIKRFRTESEAIARLEHRMLSGCMASRNIRDCLIM